MALIEPDDDICAHPGCACAALSDSKYCSPYCEEAGYVAERVCGCGHAACAGVGISPDEGELLPQPA